MLKIHDIQVGDYVTVNYEGNIRRGEVTNVNRDDNQVCVHNGVQEFWYELDQIGALPISDEELENLKFHKHIEDNGQVKYSKGAFRIILPSENDFSRMDLRYRDETRHLTELITINQLQNHFHAMTKVHLNDESFD